MNCPTNFLARISCPWPIETAGDLNTNKILMREKGVSVRIYFLDFTAEIQPIKRWNSESFFFFLKLGKVGDRQRSSFVGFSFQDNFPDTHRKFPGFKLIKYCEWMHISKLCLLSRFSITKDK